MPGPPRGFVNQMLRAMWKAKIGSRPYTINPYKRDNRRFKNKARLGRQLQLYGSSGKNRIGFPKKQLVNMRYNESFLLNPTNGGAAVEYVFRANSIFDPDFTGVGHQPIGHDQWQTFYSTYVVVGSVINIRILHDETAENSTANAVVGVLLNDGSTLPSTTKSTIQEQGLGSWKVLQGMQNGNTVKLNQKFSAKKFFSVSNIADNQDRIGAQFGSNPPSTGDAFFIVWAATTIAGGNASASIECSVQIEYSVMLSDPIALGQS